MLTVMVSFGKVVRVQSMVVLIHRAIQKVLRLITHELSDSGEEKKKINSSTEERQKYMIHTAVFTLKHQGALYDHDDESRDNNREVLHKWLKKLQHVFFNLFFYPITTPMSELTSRHNM